MRLEIRYNGEEGEVNCYVCKKAFTPIVGPELVYIGIQEPVCPTCGERMDARLLSCLKMQQRWAHLTQAADALDADDKERAKCALTAAHAAFDGDYNLDNDYTIHAIKRLSEALLKAL